MLASGRATSSQTQDGRPRSMAIALYVAASMAVLVSAFSLPREVARTCAPSPEQADLELCIETQRFVSSSGRDAALALVLATTVITAGAAWLQWRSAANARQQSGVVATLQFRVDRFRRWILLLSVASTPLIAGLAIGAVTSSSYTMGERTCRPGTGMVVEFCEQPSIETQRIIREASPWSIPLIATGALLLVGTAYWWIQARRVDHRTTIPEYRYSTTPPAWPGSS